ncbi:MAG TPA: hypothetical protein PL110_13975, partial [Candidatus Eremiobacteraeota bacterium]|nr:hypothetical protein [Candidatus Eremiobacteraeota bacterium]
MNNFSNLNSIIKSSSNPKRKDKITYMIPKAWTIDPLRGADHLQELVSSGEITRPVAIESPYKLIETALKRILDYNKKQASHIEQEKKEIDLQTGRGITAVNGLARVLSMYDHDGDGFIGSNQKENIILNKDGICEMGTFIKNILILPYLK